MVGVRLLYLSVSDMRSSVRCTTLQLLSMLDFKYWRLLLSTIELDCNATFDKRMADSLGQAVQSRLAAKSRTSRSVIE